MILERITHALSTSGGAATLSDREAVMSVLANPEAYGTDAKFAIQVLLECATGDTTFHAARTPVRTTDVAKDFKLLVEFLTDPAVWFDKDPYCAQPDVPQFVPADWAASLNVKSVEDTSFRLPWLDELDD